MKIACAMHVTDAKNKNKTHLCRINIVYSQNLNIH